MTFSYVAVTVTPPAPIACSSPALEIIATAVFEDFQVAVLVMLRLEPSDKSAVADNWTESPMFSVATTPDTKTELTVDGWVGVEVAGTALPQA